MSHKITSHTPSWRDQDESTRKRKQPRSHGVASKGFHSTWTKSSAQLRRVFQETYTSVNRQQRKRISKGLQSQREMFDQETILKIFPFQQPALEFLDELTKKTTPVDCDGESGEPLWSKLPRVFAVEKNSTGKRKYLVGHIGRFLDFYWRKTDPNQRHYYELIREKTPCRLYFDLEFSKECNPQISVQESDQLMEDFILELSSEFERHYQIKIDRTSVLDLESSTKKKFSRHLIIHSEALFANTAACGRFVKVFVGRLANDKSTGELTNRRPVLAKYLFVNSGVSEKKESISTNDNPNTAAILANTCFVDLGVYTKNRLFRIMGSSKFGKPASVALRLATSNKFPFCLRNDQFYLPAMKKLQSERNHELDDSNMTRFETSNDWTVHAKGLCESLVVPLNGSHLRILHDSVEAKALVSQCSSTSNIVPGKINGRIPLAIYPKTALRLGRSQFTALDDFVQKKLANRGGVEGSIRGWSLSYSDSNKQVPISIIYQINHNRYCEVVGRPHKRNNIMWVVDFDIMSAYQRCWDPDCRAIGFRGIPNVIPQTVQAAVQEVLFDYELAALD